MTKTIRVSDEVYDKLKNDADVHFRTIGGQIEWLYTLSDKPLSVAVRDGVTFDRIKGAEDINPTHVYPDSTKKKELRYRTDVDDKVDWGA